jgi:hypothetical protein
MILSFLFSSADMNDQTNILVSLMDVTVYGLEDIFFITCIWLCVKGEGALFLGVNIENR